MKQSKHDLAMCVLAERLLNAELVVAIENLFTHCAMTHKHWGEGCNQKEADAAIATAKELITRAKR